jgi:hypothetical protein
VPAVISQVSAGRRLRLLALGTVAIAALAAAGCGEKSEPEVHAPATTVAPTTTAAPGVTTRPTPTPTAPVPKTTP